MRIHTLAFFICWFSVGIVSNLEAAKPKQRPVEFNRDIRPILSDTCYTCHGPDKGQRVTDFRLDIEEAAKADLGGYRAIVPGNRKQSHLWQRITADDPSRRMPPTDSGRQLTQQQIELLGRWIDQGADWQKHWSFIPPSRPKLPTVQNKNWPENPIDRFILARLEDEGLKPSPQASKETLIRRVTLDLTGLPPTIEEVEAFLADDSPHAYEKVVDRLLASPRYGERMVLEWLDAARYSDTNGYQTDGTRPMWPWRDWVIRALNENRPFDQFTVEQIAGDMLPDPTLEQKIATGFNRNHMLNGEGGRIAEESRVEYVVDRLETTGTVWLGLTIGCARCHDHKYDPVAQKEFYQLYSYFNNIDETGAVDLGRKLARPVIELPTEKQKAQRASLQKQIGQHNKKLQKLEQKLLARQAEWEQQIQKKEDGSAQLPQEVAAVLKIPADKRSDEQAKKLREHYLSQSDERNKLKQKLEQTRKELNKLNRSVMKTMVMREREKKRENHVLIRGQYDNYGQKVQPGVPDCLHPLPENAPNNRLGFAKWLVDDSNPLTARVTVNRYWQMFFGEGLVKTPEDFGSQGKRPTHPRLLDWLATEFQRDWDVKAMHKLIVTSATYRQSSRVTPELLRRDPQNELLARGPRYRWNSLVIRDQALALSGLLVEKMGGPPVKPYQPEGIWSDFSFGKIVFKQDHGEDLYRRSLYTFWRRSVGPTNLFDNSSRQVCTVRRTRTNTPLHALVLMNDVTYAEAARAFAQRMMTEGGQTPQQRIHWAFRLATARHPKPQEKKVLLSTWKRLRSRYQDNQQAARKLVTVGEAPRNEELNVTQHAAYTGIASLILNLDEVISKE